MSKSAKHCSESLACIKPSSLVADGENYEGDHTAKERATLKRIAAETDAKTQQAFQTAFAAWKKTWFEAGLAISSDPHTRTRSLRQDGV